MSTSSSIANSHSDPLWPLHMRSDRSRGLRRFAGAVVAGLLFGLLCAAGGTLRHNTGFVATFWPADGILTAFLMVRSRNQWWYLLLAAWLGDAASILVLGGPLSLSLVLALCNIAEVLIASLLMGAAIARFRDLASAAVMARFVLFAVVLAPAVSGVMAAAYYHFAFGAPLLHVFAKWFPPYALGMALMVPLTLGVRQMHDRKFFSHIDFLRTGALLLLTCLVTAGIFEQSSYPLLFVLVPLLMLVAFSSDIASVVMAIFEVSIIGSLFTLHGRGPCWLHAGATVQTSVLLLQLLLLVLIVSFVPFAAAVERQRQLRGKLLEGMERYQLLADNSRDIVVLSNIDEQRLYVSPSVTDVLGWTQEEWVGTKSTDFMHPDDIPGFRRMLRETLQQGSQRTFCYRTRHQKGHYVSMEARVRTVRDKVSGIPNAFVANLRDISRRVEIEHNLDLAHRQMQELAAQDGLTGLANRRQFDDALELEWRRARRNDRTVALLMVDIDHFKRINDSYGHRAGDRCLQTLALLIGGMVRRPGDLVARYGGEEFAFLLPEMDDACAMLLAERICRTIRDCRVDLGVGASIALTASIGVAVLVPLQSVRADMLVEAAGQALSMAKASGRDRVQRLIAPHASSCQVDAAIFNRVQ